MTSQPKNFKICAHCYLHCQIASLPHCHLAGQNLKWCVLSKAFNVFQTYNMVNTTAWNIALNGCACILYVLTSIWVLSTLNAGQNILFHRFSRQKAEKERKSKKWCNIYYSTLKNILGHAEEIIIYIFVKSNLNRKCDKMTLINIIWVFGRLDIYCVCLVLTWWRES